MGGEWPCKGDGLGGRNHDDERWFMHAGNAVYYGVWKLLRTNTGKTLNAGWHATGREASDSTAATKGTSGVGRGQVIKRSC